MHTHPVIGMVLFPDATQLDFTAPYEVFARIPNAQVHVISDALDAVKTERGLRILPGVTYQDCPPLDVLFIPGGPGQIQAEQDAALMEFIRSRGQAPGCMISSVCTGALLLGAAGLLHGKKATTHWSCLDLLPYYGAQAVDAPVVEDRNIITGAGVTNGIDLALHVAEKLCGSEATHRIARMIEYPHASAHPDKVGLARLSEAMLAESPHRVTRLKAAQAAAERFSKRAAHSA